ncbi:hypothetical protein RQP54_07645 [Curvibacter sp. APW13]|uniref:hypothetical protein n=1 Tax=Curvibacter sp. APW13 TaxID=3077236 RepID=UPI0028E0722F|nr:hypothetical protein [Curvibacter sp. APW13]MDT8990738.1 hypothetical protein [Curvibacter sp. APW13]
MQESLTLSTVPPAPDVATATSAEGAQPLSHLVAQVQALRSVVQSQKAQLQILQAQQQAQPLVGWTTDAPWGLALEGLVLGMVALGLGAASMWGFRPAPGRRPAVVSPPPAAISAPPAFSDSLLYLADQEDEPDAPVAVPASLHDPRYDHRGRVFAQDEDDVELDYYRMALTRQGLSVTAGAGRVDSDRVPLDGGEDRHEHAHGESVPSAFASPPSGFEFDQRAAAEEVERVRRYLAQRRADRAKAHEQGLASSPVAAAQEPPPARPISEEGGTGHQEAAQGAMTWEALLPKEEQLAAPQQPVMVPPEPSSAEGVPDHTDLAEGASLLAALSEEDTGVAGITPATEADTADPAMNLLEWETPVAAQTEPAQAVSDDMAPDGLELGLPNAAVQLQLAQEFRDLGLWDEARERVLEILAQPDDGHHAQAQALLDELAQTAPARLEVEPEFRDPWSLPGEG